MKEQSLVQNLILLRYLPKNWEISHYEDVLKDVSGGNDKVLQSDFLELGKYPIVDQGKELVAGYSNEKQNLVILRPPYIIFGDHTRIFKYIDFQFVMGADGIKVLKAVNKEKHFEKYLYYFLTTLNIPNTGYNRHYKYVKDIQIPIAPLATQKRIAAILDAADLYRQKTKTLVAKYDQLAQSLFLEMFGDPVRNEKGWEKKKLEDLTDISSGSTPSRENETFYIGNNPWIKTTELRGAIINDSQEKISDEALRNTSCRLYPKGTILIAMYGQGVTRGKVGILGIEAATNQACAALPPTININSDYLFNHLKFSYEELRELGRGGNQPNLNSGLVKSFKVLNPPLTFQTQFADRIQLIEAQKQQAQSALQKSETLFNSLLQKAFKSELVS